MKSKWIRAVASLMTCAVLSAQMPAVTLNAAQQTNTIETEIAKTERGETENTESESTKTERTETESSESEYTESESAKAERTETESSESENTESESVEARSDESESETETSEETSGVETTETEQETKPAETDSDKIRYIRGRELTPEEVAEQEAMVPDYMPELEVVELPDSNLQISTYDLRAEELPQKYDARENKAITAVKNQNPWGTCWTFSFLAAMENSLVRQNYASVDEIDLSERHLAYFAYHTGYDALGNASDDTITSSPEKYYLKRGGNDYRAAAKLMNWQGAAFESEYPYSTSLPEDLEQGTAQDAAYTLKGCYFIPTKSLSTEERVQTVKELIMEYDCVSWSYYHSNTFYNASTATYFNNEVGKTTNHAITVVGWDDTYAKENFKTSPENDGAWIVRNSWGSDWGKNGYFYVSYEDVSMGSGNAACVVTADKAGIYDNNYFHGNTARPVSYTTGYRKVAQIYQAKSPNASREKLSAVSFMMSSSGQEYSIQIYKNPERVDGEIKDPESGIAMLKNPIEGVTTYAGVYTVEIPELVLFGGDDEMAIVISFPEDQKAKLFCDISEKTSSTTGSCESANTTEPGESMYMTSSIWQDLNTNNRSFRINMLTNDKDPVLPATPKLLSADVQEGAVRLQWEKADGAEAYDVERSDNAGEFRQIARIEGGDTLEYIDSSVSKPNAYAYRVIACNTDITGEPLESEVSDTKEITLYPEPVSIPKITGGRQVELSMPTVEQAQGYAIYRSQTGDDNSFVLIADQVTDSTYTDSDVQPDTTYYYKVLVTINGLTSQLTDTSAASITTKPLLAGLSLTVAEKDMLVNSSQELMVAAEPAHYPYQEEIAWFAFGEDGQSLTISDDGGSIVVSGNDGKEILRITDNQIIATGASEEKTVRLEIAIGEINAACTVSIYQNGFWVSNVKDQTYTGKSLTPKIRVYDKSRLLTEGTDYSVSYKNNINVNSSGDSEKAPKIVVTGKGNYSGTEIVTFQILPQDISDGAFAADNMVCAYDSKKVQHPVPELYRNSVKLTYNKDFTAEYPDTAQDSYKAIGTYKILIKGKGNYSGTREVSLTITDEGLISKATVSKVKDQTYTGNPIEPKLTVKLGKVVLTENQDYTVTYANNISSGTATAIITGNGTTYHGTKRVSFKIVGTSITKAAVAGLEKNLSYTGKAVEQTGYQLSIRTAGGTTTLKEGTDYQVSYVNHTNAGTATILFTGMNSYDGTLKKTYRITPYDIHSDSAGRIAIELPKKAPYAKGGSRPEPVVTCDGKELVYGTDYKLSYKNNTTAVSSKKSPEVVVTGIKNFKGTRTLSFAITTQDIGLLTMNASDKVYSKKAGAYKTKLSVTDLDGKVLTAGKDYGKTFRYTYASQTTLADGRIRGEGETVGDKDIVPSGTVLNVTITGMNNYTGTLTGQYRITEYDLSKVKVTVENQIYTGKAIEPGENDITVTFQGRKLTYGTDYDIAGYTNNVRKGNAKLTIRGIAQFGGTKTATFRIKSKTVVWWK